MTATRRDLLRAGSGIAAALCLSRVGARAAGVVEIAMDGRRDGSRVWFDPVGVHLERGQAVRWLNRDAGNSHTATAYHPANDRPRRIPEAASPWDSGYLLPGETFSVAFPDEGVFDYFCIPHEMAGMVGRIVVGRPGPGGWPDPSRPAAGVPEAALDTFPSVEEILRAGSVRPG